ncbi:MAG: DUF5668 domain-containing protein [Bacteroidales bacterium]|nr:DUF5668 domain-containing protein [Bacteroidales bacterium]
MKTKNIIWGLILVLIGVLFILKNLDIIYFSWYSLWRLWPLLLVLIGVTILPVKDGIKVVLTIIVLIAAAFFLISFPNFHNWNDDRSINNSRDRIDDKDPQDIDQRIFEAYDSTINEADLIFDAAAGNFKIGQSTDELFEFDREGNLGRYTYSIKDLGTKREIRIELEEGRIIRTDLRNKVTMKLNTNPVWDIKVDVGAANIELDLSSFKIRKLEIDGGASSINIRLGTLQAESKIKINSGASSIDIKVPQEFACEVNTSTVLSSKDLEGFNKVGNGTYVTPDFSDKTKNIVIEVEAAVSSLNVERY